MRTKLTTVVAAFVFSWNAFAQEETCQSIDFPAGWSIISTYIEIDESYKGTISFFQEVVDILIVSKNNDAQIYWPEFGIIPYSYHNDQGYAVKFFESDTITTCGTLITPEEYPITLEQGWNIIPYIRITPQDTEEALSDIADEIILVKDYLGNIYLPSMNYNGIGDLQPGQGYQIKMNSEQTLIYDAND